MRAYTVDKFAWERVLGESAQLESAAKVDQRDYDDSTTMWAHYHPRFVIDFMAVHVEGYDWQVLRQGERIGRSVIRATLSSSTTLRELGKAICCPMRSRNLTLNLDLSVIGQEWGH